MEKLGRAPDTTSQVPIITTPLRSRLEASIPVPPRGARVWGLQVARPGQQVKWDHTVCRACTAVGEGPAPGCF